MVQHAFVVENPQGPDPVKIEPYLVNIFRDDQNLTWKISIQGWGWSKTKPPIEITRGVWYGSAFHPIGEPPNEGELDRRLVVATGPGPIIEGDAVIYTYLANVTNDPNGDPLNDIQIRGFDQLHNVPIDPDIGNQPQP
jgi:hypothetical protein